MIILRPATQSAIAEIEIEFKCRTFSLMILIILKIIFMTFI